ncbi:MAG: SDR family oxidoreductase [Gemmatimonadota bacterium]|nr:SDR family oxidoreductase [Gemmatimonadota bacterium]
MRPLALVTGASAGIGREFAEQLAARGYDLVLVARDQARLTALAERLRERGASSEVLTADLARDADVDRVVGRIRELPRLDLLVNNAGFGTRGTLAETAPGPQETMIRVHVLATMRLTQAALPGMVARGAGAIVNVASIAAFIASPRNVNYCATKAYVVTFTEGLAAELRGTGVRAQALCPGFTHSEFHARMASNKKAIPDFMWLDAPHVVRTSLDAVEHGGPTVVVPGVGYKVVIPLLRMIPRGLVSRVSGLVRR